MDPGVSHSGICTQDISQLTQRCTGEGKGFGLLVPVGSTLRRAYTSGLSTSSSRTTLRGLVLEHVSRLDAFSGYRS